MVQSVLLARKCTASLPILPTSTLAQDGVGGSVQDDSLGGLRDGQSRYVPVAAGDVQPVAGFQGPGAEHGRAGAGQGDGGRVRAGRSGHELAGVGAVLELDGLARHGPPRGLR